MVRSELHRLLLVLASTHIILSRSCLIALIVLLERVPMLRKVDDARLHFFTHAVIIQAVVRLAELSATGQGSDTWPHRFILRLGRLRIRARHVRCFPQFII